MKIEILLDKYTKTVLILKYVDKEDSEIIYDRIFTNKSKDFEVHGYNESNDDYVIEECEKIKEGITVQPFENYSPEDKEFIRNLVLQINTSKGKFDFCTIDEEEEIMNFLKKILTK